MKKKSWLLALLLTLTTSAQSAPANEKLSLVRNNIKVWTYRSEANPVIQYKAETTYDVPLERAVSLVLDVARAPEWVPYMGMPRFCRETTRRASLYCIWCSIFLFR